MDEVLDLAITEALTSELARMRANGLRLMAAVNASRPAFVALATKNLSDEVWYVRIAAAGALGSIGATDLETVESLRWAARHDDHEMVRVLSLHSLERLAPDDPQTLVLAQNMLEDPAVGARMQARLTVRSLTERRTQ